MIASIDLDELHKAGSKQRLERLTTDRSYIMNGGLAGREDHQHFTPRAAIFLSSVEGGTRARETRDVSQEIDTKVFLRAANVHHQRASRTNTNQQTLVELVASS